MAYSQHDTVTQDMQHHAKPHPQPDERFRLPNSMVLHVHMHGDDDEHEDHLTVKEFRAELAKIHAKLNQLRELIMATAQQFQEGFTKIDAATTAIGKRIQAYIDKVNAGGMTEEEETAALAQLGGVVSPLEEMAKDPVNPVPEPVPTE